MLSGASFLSYQAAPLKSIRDAIQDDEHHIVRVNEEGTGEIYDLNLSHSKPYASPVQRSTAATQQQHDSEKGVGTSADARRGHDASTVNTSATRKSYEKPAQNGILGLSSLQSDAAKYESTAANGGTGTAGEGARSSGFLRGTRPLRLPQIVGKRQNDGVRDSLTAAGIPQDGATTGPDAQKAQDGTFELARQLQAGELPPSPPLEDDLNTYVVPPNGVASEGASSSKGAIADAPAMSSGQSSATKEQTLPERRMPRRKTAEDPTSIRRPLARRDPSVNSTASTAYLTASSLDGSEDDGARPTLVAEPSSFLHPSSAAHHDQSSTSLSRKLSPQSSFTLNTSPTRMPSRRNTTGAPSSGQLPRRRHGSVGSQHSQRNQIQSEGAVPSQTTQEEASAAAASARPQGTPLRTGDAGFDEVVAKQYNQIIRERESKKLRERPEHDQQASQGHQSLEGTGTARGGGMHLQRARSRKGTDDDGPKAMVGNIIGEGHVNFVLMYNMLTGIRIGVSRCHAKMKRPLTDADYTAKHKFTFDIVGNELTPEAKYDFKFKDYAPWVFRELREHFHLDPADYLFSLTAKYILSELGSPGKSGSFFYFSRDYRFIIKTIRHNEHKFLRRILKDYHLHIKENPHTLLSRFYGLHRVKLPGGKKIHFVIMNNLFPPHKDIHETYDLKGSAVGREYPEEKAAQKKGAVLKDLNWIKRDRELELGPAKRAMFEAQIRSDVALLQRLGIMDYSLLIGLHDMKRGNKEGLRQDALQVVQPDSHPQQTTTQQNAQVHGLRREPTRTEKEAYALRAAVRRSDAKALGSSSAAKLPERETSDRHHLIFYQDEGGFRSTDDENRPSDWIYYFGIIDTLTLYSGVKRGEHYWKSLTHNSRMISSIHPVPYGQRFCDFLFSLIKGADTSKRPRMQ